MAQQTLTLAELPRSAWHVLRLALDQWSLHRSGRIGAALAYYSVFSLGPLLLIVIAVAGIFFGETAVRGQLIGQFRDLLGANGAKMLEGMLAGTGSADSGLLTAVIGVVLLLFAALGVVVQLKDALNTIWNVDNSNAPAARWYLRTYGMALLGVLALGFLFAVSLALSAGLAALSDWLGAGRSAVFGTINFVVSFAVLTGLFAALLKWFPDTPVAWRDVWPGALLTALLFNIGKVAIGWYVGSQGFESTYGAAASIVVLLVWIYYSAQIVLFGAEVTHAYAHERGSRQSESLDARSPHNVEIAKG